MAHWIQAHQGQLLSLLSILSALGLVNAALRRLQATRRAPTTTKQMGV